MKAKLQAPRSKLQGSSKLQLPIAARAWSYPESTTTTAYLAEENSSARHAFDLEERTARFGEAIIRYLKKVPRGPDNDRLIDQLVGCVTSLGANYCEANEGVSKKDFRCIIGRCKKGIQGNQILPSHDRGLRA